MANPDLDLYCQLLRWDFTAFAERCFRHLHAGAPYHPNWHIELIAGDLAAVMAGQTRRLIINVPPRHLKSILTSVALVAWWLGHHPAAHLMCVSYAQDLADKLARDCRSVMESAWYRAAFPGTRLSPARNAVGEFTTTKGGSRYATSVGGVVTGRGADAILIDDPLKPDEAASEVQRRRVNEWFDGTLVSRLNDKRTGAIIVIMQRLHEDDLVGHLTGSGEVWGVRKLAAVAVEDERHVIRSAMGEYVHCRKAGEALHPEREPLAELEVLRRRIREANFASQYQQEPTPLGGGIIKVEWFKAYGPAERPATFDLILQSWDSANKATELADYSVCTSWGVLGTTIYLLHVLRARLGYPDLKRAVREQQELHHADVVLIEDRASGTQLIQEFQAEGFHNVTAYQPAGDKVMRMHAQTALIENGRVHLPREAAWLDGYLHELAMFPRGKHDDQVDSTAQALDWIKGHARQEPIITYYENLHRAQGILLPQMPPLPEMPRPLPLLPPLPAPTWE
ncbi:MAG: phage terminase large subunit [Rhodospirillales bacterium]|nr:phage terminase large subunit [Rhodospirillales bacterium]